jgi:hypothetical protein
LVRDIELVMSFKGFTLWAGAVQVWMCLLL